MVNVSELLINVEKSDEPKKLSAQAKTARAGPSTVLLDGTDT